MTFRFRIYCLFFWIVLLNTLYAKTSNITFSADTLQGSGAKGNSSTTLIGNAQVTVDSLTIKGDRIELTGKNYRYITASGKVSGEDAEKGFSFSTASLSYDREKEIAEFLGGAQINDTKNNVEAAGERIQYNQKIEVILLQMNVRLKSKDIRTESLFALYYRSRSTLELTGNPVVKKEKDEFHAARISVNLDTNDIRLEGKVSGSVTDGASDDGEKNAAAQ